MVNAAQSFIKLYREYRNGVLSESELIDAVEPLNREITCLFLEQSDLPYPPKELHEWANTHTQLAGTIQDFSLYYDRKTSIHGQPKTEYTSWIHQLNAMKLI